MKSAQYPFQPEDRRMSNEKRTIQSPADLERALPKLIQKVETIKSQEAPKQYPNAPKPKKQP
jgi:hypothetical protein